MKTQNREQLIQALAAGDIQKLRNIKNKLPFFIVITNAEGYYEFNILYPEGTGNSDKRTGRGDWHDALTRDEIEALEASHGFNYFDVQIMPERKDVDNVSNQNTKVS